MATATSPSGGVNGSGTAGTLPIWASATVLGNSLLTQATTTITLTGGATATNSGFYDFSSINDFRQFDLKNTSTGTSAQSTYSLTADNGTATTGFMSINVNNSTFSAVNAYSIGGVNDCSVLASANDLYVANASATKDIILSTGKVASPFFDERFRIQNTAGVGGALFTLGNSLVVRKAATQDSVALAGRAGGTSSFSVTISPPTLSASWTATLPNLTVFLTGSAAALTANRLPKGTATAGVEQDSQIADGVSGNVLTIAGTLTAPRTITLPDAAVTIPTGTLLTGTLSNVNRLDSTSSAGVVKESQIVDGVTGNVLTIAGTLTAPRTLTLPDAAVTIPTGTLITGSINNADVLPAISSSGVLKESQIKQQISGGTLLISATLTGSPRISNFPDANAQIQGSAFTLTNNRLPKATTTVGMQQDSQIADGVSGNVLTIAGTLTAPRTLTLPDAAVTIPSGTILTGTLSNANRLDSTSAAGVVKESLIADGISTSVLTIAGTLTAPRTLTLPDAAVTIPTGTLLTGTLSNVNRLDSTSSAGVVKESQIADGVSGNVLTIAGALTAPRTITLPDAAVTIPTGTLLTGTLANANRLDSTSAAGIVKESQIADGVTGSVLTIAGTLTAPRTLTLPDAAVTIPTGTLLTGTLANANRLDSTSAAGVVKESLIADGISTSVLTIAGTLTAPRTHTHQDKSGTIALVDQDPSASFKNKIINYDFSIAQAGTSFTAVGYTLDQWYLTFGSTAPTLTQQTRTLGTLARPGKKFLRLVSVAGTAAPTIENRVEFVENFAGDTITVSVTGKAGAARSVTVNVIQNFGAGGSPSGSVTTAVGTINLTTSVARTSVTVAIPSITGKTLGTAGDYVSIQLIFPTLTAETYDIYDVQAERGSLMTDLVQRPTQVELALCERFFVTLPNNTNTVGPWGSLYNTTAGKVFWPFRVPMRAIPTLSGTGNSFEIIGVGVVTGTISNIVLGTQGVNFDGQSLSTAGTVGYPLAYRGAGLLSAQL